MNIEDLTPEVLASAKACTTPEELIELARREGYELTDEQLESFAGGVSWIDCETLEDNVPAPLTPHP